MARSKGVMERGLMNEWLTKVWTGLRYPTKDGVVPAFGLAALGNNYRSRPWGTRSMVT